MSGIQQRYVIRILFIYAGKRRKRNEHLPQLWKLNYILTQYLLPTINTRREQYKRKLRKQCIR